jgi:hypothetical protein
MIALHTDGLVTIGQLMSDDEIQELLGVLEEVSRQEGWVTEDGITRYRMESIYLGAYVQNRIVGGIRIIPLSPLVLPPSVSTWPCLTRLAVPGMAHAGLLLIQPTYRCRGDLFWLLCIELWRICRSHLIATLVLEATTTTAAVYERIGFPLTAQGDERLYSGERCRPYSMQLADVERSLLQKASRSSRYQLLLEHAYRP